MRIDGAVALVTGANRGIGAAFAQALLDNGAKQVFAGARNPSSITNPRLTPIQLDVTDPEQVAAAVEAIGDASIVINNAGIAGGSGLLEGSLEGAREELEVNYFGTWSVSRSFAPVLGRNGGGALVNMLSVASWRSLAAAPGYAASKSAQWSLTNAFRVALSDQGTLVVGVHCGFVDTDLSAWVDAPKITSASVAEQTMRAILDDEPEVLADDVTRQVKAELSAGVQRADPAVV